MYLHETIYKYKPYALILAGAVAIVTVSNPLAYIGGGLLVLAGTAIYKMRTVPT